MFKKLTSILTSAVLLGTGLSIIGAASASAVGISDNSTVSLVSMDSTMSSNGQGCTTRQAISTSTRVRSWTSGDNLDFGFVNTASFVWGSSHQTAYNNIVSMPSTTRTTFTPVSGTTYTFYTLKEGSTTANYFCHAGQVDLLINGTDAITGWVVSPKTFFTTGESSGVSISTTQGAAILGPSAVAEQRQRQASITTAKVTLSDILASGKTASLTSLSAAGMTVNSQSTLDRVNSRILELPIQKRSNIAEIEKIVDLENFVDRVSNSESRPSITTSQLVSRGFIAVDNRLKISLTNALLSRDSSSLNTVEKIKAAIVEETERLQERVKRTAEIKAKIAARNK